eukprot:COSAG04_NODE_1754_length_5687_cov_2.326593_7_plen_112_part_00
MEAFQAAVQAALAGKQAGAGPSLLLFPPLLARRLRARRPAVTQPLHTRGSNPGRHPNANPGRVCPQRRGRTSPSRASESTEVHTKSPHLEKKTLPLESFRISAKSRACFSA